MRKRALTPQPHTTHAHGKEGEGHRGNEPGEVGSDVKAASPPSPGGTRVLPPYPLCARDGRACICRTLVLTCWGFRRQGAVVRV